MEKITDKYYLGSNKNTFILYEKRISETTGKETYKNIGYRTTILQIKEITSRINHIFVI